jgi:hypothetical protein
VVSAVLAVVVLAVAYFTSVKDWTGAYLLAVGGETSPACWSAAFLLGVVWNSPGRSTSSAFLAIVVGLAAVFLLLNGSGRLWWRFLAEREWANGPGKDGSLAQTTGWTCAPTAAAMLLHAHGISATEGEMAYLAGTSWMGTDLYATAEALDRKAAPSGLRARVERTDFETCLARGVPFVVTVRLPGIGGHALFVERIDARGVEVIDPIRGRRQVLPRERFESLWEGRIVFLSPA